MAKIKHFPSIEFLPVCSECGYIIREKVEYRETPTRVGGTSNIIARGELEPSICPNCGVWFDRIILPRDLPFEGYY